MVRVFVRGLLAVFLLSLVGVAQNRDVLVPAGTLLQCTMNEPDFSSATASPGDPFLCYPRSIEEFGTSVFPRGTYLVGHMADSREPGRFFGKGYLQVVIDRVGLPSTDLPISAKVISAAGYRVDRAGDILGKGHATRDVVEWMLPPLWPWKLVSLPARGPRPELKGEVRLTLRMMDDLIVPQLAAATPRSVPPSVTRPAAAPGWHYFGAPSSYPLVSTGPRPLGVSYRDDTAAAATPAWSAEVTLFITREGAVVPVAQYYRRGQELDYSTTDGALASMPLASVDWAATARANVARGVRVELRSAPAGELAQ